MQSLVLNIRSDRFCNIGQKYYNLLTASDTVNIHSYAKQCNRVEWHFTGLKVPHFCEIYNTINECIIYLFIQYPLFKTVHNSFT